MTTTSVRWLLWMPRVLGILAGLFLGLFALDAFSEGKPLAQALPDFIIHLVPGAVLFAVVALAWRWPWVGAAAFLGLALAYAASNIEPARLDPDHLRTAGDRRRAVPLELASSRTASRARGSGATFAAGGIFPARCRIFHAMAERQAACRSR